MALAEFVLLGLSGVAIALFLWLFTGELNTNNGRWKLLWMARFSYLFVLTLMVLVLASFKYPAIFANPPTAGDNYAFAVVPACIEAPVQDSVPAGIDCGLNAHQWVVNIGGIRLDKAAAPGSADGQAPTTPTTTPTSIPATAPVPPAYVVPANVVHLQGGLVVPLYVIMVALMGGSVSMTRRVPEIQKQAWRYIELRGTNAAQDAGDSADGTPPAPAIEPGEANLKLDDSIYLDADGEKRATRRPITLEYARECLIFQIMQVVSAPIVAMIAFYLFEPDSKALSIAIAFISGFASESVLIGIRRLGDGLLAKASGGNAPPDPEPPKPA